MKKENNEITIKINVSDAMLSAIANVLVMTSSPKLPQALMTLKSTTTLPPSPPLGFRAKGGN